MAQYDYDLFVIGAGSGGVRAARVAAGYGARVAIAEDHRVGGTCVIRGCVPKKLLSYASHVHDEIADAAGFGWSIADARFDWPTLIANKDKEIDRLNGIYKSLLAGSKVALFESRARLGDAHTVEVGGRRVTAGIVLIATGARPELPQIPGIEHAITSNEAFHLPRLPKSVALVGGGYIALEFAGIFNGLGAKASVFFRRDQILYGFDQDVRNFLADEMRKKGIDLRAQSAITAIAKTGDGVELTLKDGGRVSVETVMYATGRNPNTADLGLEALGVELDKVGAIAVDAYSKTAVANIYAVGDCTNRLNLTPVAIREGHAFADTVFGKKPWAMDHQTVASAVFSQPPVGVVGLTEARARAAGKPLDIYKVNFKPLKHTLSGSSERTLMKLVVDRESQVVLGAHMVGMDAPEIIQALAIAVKMRATKRQFDEAVAVHPTTAEEFVTMRTTEPEPVEPGLEAMQD
jgi:glutathione reductase (NADPH)